MNANRAASFNQRNRRPHPLINVDHHDFLSSRLITRPVVDVFLPESALKDGDSVEDIIRRRRCCFADGDQVAYDNNNNIFGGASYEYNVRLIPELVVESVENDDAEECSISATDTSYDISDESEKIDVVMQMEPSENPVIDDDADHDMVSISIDDPTICEIKPPGKKRARNSPSTPPPPLVKPSTAPELTKEMEKANAEKLSTNDENAVVAQSGTNRITKMDLASLCDNEWLADPVVDFYLHLIQKRNNSEGTELPTVYSFFSTFYALLASAKGLDKLRETTDEDIFRYDLVFFPVCVSHHWRLIVMHPHQKTIRVFNSFKAFPDLMICKNIQRFLEYEEKKQLALRGEDNATNGSSGNWKIHFEDNIPQQENGLDCGVFMLAFAEYLCRRQTNFDFSQKHMRYYRQRIMYELISTKLLI